ncbi:hypothetical protein C8R43DRAFT_272369 [Mycena crocata]|nr:hypothetical protein C8R43DRAFT_272369 [Mycena crocata]
MSGFFWHLFGMRPAATASASFAIPHCSMPDDSPSFAHMDSSIVFRDGQISRSFFLAGFVILVYDHILTLQSEVKYIWSSRLRLSTYWFLCVRYFSLAANITVSVFYFGHLKSEVCVKMQIAYEMLLLVQEVFVECSFYHRVFAMYGLNRWILACLVSVGGVFASVALASSRKQ